MGPYPSQVRQNLPWPYGWNIPVQRQSSRKEPAAGGKDLIGQLAARIVIQNYNPAARLAQWLSGLPRDCRQER